MLFRSFAFFEKPVATTLDQSLSGPGTILRLPKAVQSGFLPKKAKKPDWTRLLNSNNEVKAYLDSRYISFVEAAWRLFEFGMHLEWPSVYRLSVHLENQQSITYQDDDDAQAVLEAAGNRDTTLTG